MKLHFILPLAALSAAPFAGTARADVLYDNPSFSQQVYDCHVSSICTYNGVFTGVAAQQFTLTAPGTVNGASFQAIQQHTPGLNISYALYEVNPVTGLPGAVLLTDAAALNSVDLGAAGYGNFHSYSGFFDIDLTHLDAGTYFLGLQEQTPYNVFLNNGVANSGAAYSEDGGLTYMRDNSYVGSYSLTIYGTPDPTTPTGPTGPTPSATPEPGSIFLLGSGLLSMAGMKRRFGRR